MPEIERKDHRLHEGQPTHRTPASPQHAVVMFVHGVGGQLQQPAPLRLRSRMRAGPPAQTLAYQPLLASVAAEAAQGPDCTDGLGRLRLPKIAPSEFVARLPLPGMWHAVAYRNRPEVRDAARRKVARQISLEPGMPRIVFAHSLGSIVVLDALHTFDFSIDLLITVGSPLGIDDGRTYEWDPKQDFPASQIGGWLNVVNTRDPVPWGRGAAGRFPQAVDAFISAGTRISGPGGVHDPAVYTGSTVVASAIAATYGPGQGR